MPKEIALQFGPKLQAHIEEVQALAQKSVEVTVGNGDPALESAAYRAEYGASGAIEQPFIRAALLRIQPEIKELLRSGGIEAVRERMEEVAKQSARGHIVDPILAEKVGNAIQAHIVD